MNNRLLYNRAIINKLSELIEKYKDLRFGQLLIDCDVVPDNLETFFEESEITWNRMINNYFCFNE